MVFRYAILFLLCSQAVAETTIDVFVGSRHFVERGNGEPWNEKNLGLGITQDNVSVGFYKNSIFNTSYYLFYNNPMYSSTNFDLDVIVGAATGYNGVMPFVAPKLIFKTKSFNTNLIVVPNPENGIYVIGLNFSFPIQ